GRAFRMARGPWTEVHVYHRRSLRDQVGSDVYTAPRAGGGPFMDDVNNPTGSNGLVAIDKRGSHALFLDPVTYAELGRLALPARPHEIAISADRRLAYVSIYGLGVYGNNAQPGNTIIVLDLASCEQVG